MSLLKRPWLVAAASIVFAFAVVTAAKVYADSYGGCTYDVIEWELELTEVTVDGEPLDDLSEYDNLTFRANDTSYGFLEFHMHQRDGNASEFMEYIDYFRGNEDRNLPREFQDTDISQSSLSTGGTQ